ncbi:MAG: heme NO-binding domain-containing protein [Armatimonadota bacterium]|nr:heme NO-binding domain-containing protein [Armatimonadota bacterium]
MKGIIFNLFESVVQSHYGEDVWDELLEKARLDGVYTSLGSYDDSDFRGLVEAASASWGMSGDEVVRWFARNALPLIATTYPGLFSPHQSTRPFVLTLNSIIHPEVRKLYPGADVPEFDFDNSNEDFLLMTYRSPRKLCAFAQGLVEGAAAHYGEEVTFEQPECMLRGDEACVFHIRFSSLKVT